MRDIEDFLNRFLHLVKQNSWKVNNDYIIIYVDHAVQEPYDTILYVIIALNV